MNNFHSIAISMFITCAAISGCAINDVPTSEDGAPAALTKATPITSLDQLEAYLQSTENTQFDHFSPGARGHSLHKSRPAIAMRWFR